MGAGRLWESRIATRARPGAAKLARRQFEFPFSIEAWVWVAVAMRFGARGLGKASVRWNCRWNADAMQGDKVGFAVLRPRSAERFGFLGECGHFGCI